ncbi:MAG TPA: ROK family protein [Capillimicrobium sp.]
MSARVAIALDAGGTKLAGGLARAGGELLVEELRQTPQTADGRDPGLRATLALAADLAAEAGARGLTVVGICAGLPEYVDAGGRLTSCDVLAWEAQPAELLAPLVPGGRCVVEADVRCGALAEGRFGAAAELGTWLYVSLGTGLSSTLVVERQPLRGARGEAIALGELDVPAAVEPVSSGNLEMYCSGEGVRRRYEAASGEDPGGALGVAQRAGAGDALAAGTLRSAGRALGRVLAGLVGLLDPEAVVLGGGLGTAPGLLRDELLDAYGRRAGHRPGAPPVLPAALGSRAGLVGAGLLALGAGTV